MSLLGMCVFTTVILQRFFWNCLRKQGGDIFVIILLKKAFYDTHSKTVIENRLRMCVGHKNYDGFY